ncbi:DUF2637 domain-containing protein [Streptomyces chartreusis]|uniref:DUF2637 domain-containing protein n=1 Tax=Streptomyces chartreusis TaxID=1969 RepID=UPI0019BA4443|nr:hypothetical protein GCM10010321_87070 [Streptomyces chartreusis]
MAAGTGETPQLTRVHRVLIGVVVFGAVIIAGIGFAGSYAAVRELAVKKGFGNFSYVFPIGIDAGICVLLALDLLLTWIRIPFPLLRQTAWLLTAATIAFNGAAAWPDPLGVGMHAVIPILFVVAVEAARHAIGRIADITADKHMEGVRFTRWLLSPLPTFLLWRRMKLWELRSYEQVIKLEQERLVYQASLRFRFGRAWRRKAPVESMMPLRLARYGVPLAETAPAGLAAAGIEELPIDFTFSVERAPAPAPSKDPVKEPAVHEEPGPSRPEAATPETPAPRIERAPAPEKSQTVEDAAEGFAEAYRAWLADFQTEPTAAQFAHWLQQHGITTGAGEALNDTQLEPLLLALKERYGPRSELAAGGEQQTDDERSWHDYFYNSWTTYAQEHGVYPDSAALAVFVFERDSITGPGGRPITGEDLAAFVDEFQQREFDETDTQTATGAAETGEVHVPHPREEEPEAAGAGLGAQAAKDQRGPRVNAPVDELPDEEQQQPAAAELTTVDRYYLAWSEFLTQRGDEFPSSSQEAQELSTYLAEAKGMHGRGGKPVSPSNLRRYLVAFRIYTLWAEQRVRSGMPSLDAIAQECAAQGITAQHSKPITRDYIADQVDDFERRWQALTHHHAQAQP